MIELNKFYLANTVYFMPINELWLCGLLNSVVIEWFYSYISNKVRGGYLRAFTDYIRQIPIANATENQKQAIKSLVKQCLEAKGKDVKELETKINQIVYELYGLSEEEIRIIEGEIK